MTKKENFAGWDKKNRFEYLKRFGLEGHPHMLGIDNPVDSKFLKGNLLHEPILVPIKSFFQVKKFSICGSVFLISFCLYTHRSCLFDQPLLYLDKRFPDK